jgi:hypothetical protein
MFMLQVGTKKKGCLCLYIVCLLQIIILIKIETCSVSYGMKILSPILELLHTDRNVKKKTNGRPFTFSSLQTLKKKKKKKKDCSQKA